MLVDLHAHYPMHVLDGEERRTHDHVRAFARRRFRARVVDLISRIANYQGPGDTPSVTETLMAEGGVGVALSVLYAPFDEMDLGQEYGAAPQRGYFDDIVAQLEQVEGHVAQRADRVAIAHSLSELDELLRAGGRPVLIHCIEGGFQLGFDEDSVGRNVAELARRGVAYVTLAHLFWRRVATNAPALPFLPDRLYHLFFPEPDEGLSELGRSAARAMVRHRVLIDVSHMSARSLGDTFRLLDVMDPERRVPVIATHVAYRFGRLEYCVTEETIARVAERGGVLGCIFCKHYMTDGLRGRVRGFDDSFRVLCRHVDRIHKVTGSFDNVAIGSDLDGYIKPALPGLEHMGHMRALQDALADRYGEEVAEQVASANALRVLRAGWH